MQRRDIVPFGSAFASPQLFPLSRLSKSLAYAARTANAWDTVSDLSFGNEHLRQQIALRYMALGMPQSTEEILITSGALEALNLCLAAVTRPGDYVAIESPAFYGCLHAVERLGLKAIEIPVHRKDGLDLSALEAALQAHDIRACWAMPNFHNPTGVTLSVDKKKALVALLARFRVPLIEDDVYGELHHGPQYLMPAKAFDREGLVMHCCSFSKSLAPGYRIGWVSAGRFADKVRKLKLMTTLSSGVPAQAAIANYLQKGGFDKHLRKLRGAFESQLDQMESALSTSFPLGSNWIRPAGGYFLWLELPFQVDPFLLHETAIANGVSVAPGAMFSATHSFRTALRLNFGHPWTSTVEEAIKTLGQMLAALARSARQ
jgi:DNA-binding transcriptional MocR family regulator